MLNRFSVVKLKLQQLPARWFRTEARRRVGPPVRVHVNVNVALTSPMELVRVISRRMKDIQLHTYATHDTYTYFPGIPQRDPSCLLTITAAKLQPKAGCCVQWSNRQAASSYGWKSTAALAMLFLEVIPLVYLRRFGQNGPM